MLLGFILFLAAKAKAICRRRPISFGASHMPYAWSMAYFAGYVPMGVGWYLLLATDW